jgi:hypothetical protein
MKCVTGHDAALPKDELTRSMMLHLFKDEPMILTESTPRNERQEQLDLAARLWKEAKEHRLRGEWVDAKRKEDRARIIERACNDT